MARAARIMTIGPMRDDALSVIACGSIAAKDLPSYLVWMRQEIDLPLRVLLTGSAVRFINPQVVAWHADEVFTSDDPGLNPTEFAHRSLGVVVLPATANTLAAAAIGLAATPAQTALLAHERPALFFPNMNETMWSKATTRRHVAALRSEGHTVVDPPTREMFVLWKRENDIGPAMPPPDQAAETIVKWLEDTLDDGEPAAD
jgi:phosphopantothenoylcysteine synthetase/decarboxylase